MEIPVQNLLNLNWNKPQELYKVTQQDFERLKEGKETRKKEIPEYIVLNRT